MRNYKSLLNKIKKINKQLDLLENKHSSEDLPELIARYTDNRIVDAFRIMYPKVSAKIEELKNKPDEDALNEAITIYKNAFYNSDVIQTAFNALYPVIKKENKPMPEIENKNKVMNDYIRKQAGMEEIPEDENKQEDNKKADMNELIRNSRKSTTQELRDIFFKRSE